MLAKLWSVFALSPAKLPMRQRLRHKDMLYSFVKKKKGQRKLIIKILVRCREHAEQTHPAAATAAPAPTAAQAGWVQPHRPRRAEVKVGKVVLKLVFYWKNVI